MRYRALLTAALRRIAADPQGRSSAERSDLAAGVRSLHIRHSRAESSEAAVGDPVRVIFYRAPGPPASSRLCACCMCAWTRGGMWAEMGGDKGAG